MTFHRRLCIIGTGLRRFGKRSSLVAILLLFLASCSTAPTDTTTPGPNTSTPGPNVTDHATELPTPVTAGDDPECEPDREWIRSGNTLTQRLELGFRSEESGAAVSVPAESLLITGDLSILDVQAVVEYDLYDLEAFGSSVVDREGCPDGLTLRFAAQAALSEVVGRRAMRDLILERLVEVEQAVHGRLQETLDLYDAGIRVLSVALQQVLHLKRCVRHSTACYEQGRTKSPSSIRPGAMKIRPRRTPMQRPSELLGPPRQPGMCAGAAPRKT